MAGALVLSLLLAAGQAATGSPDPALSARSRRGTELMEAGRYAEAVPVFLELAKAVPNNAGLLLNLGMALHLSGQDAEAVAPLQAAVRLEPGSFPANLFLGASRLRLGKRAAAVGPLEKAVRIDPAHGEARSLLVDALLGLERYSAAAAHLRRLAQREPADPAVWFTLGRTYEELVARAFEDLLKADPESAYALALVAEARLQEGRRETAFRLYRQALDRAPGLRGLHAAVAGIYRAAGHAEWAAVEEEREQRLPRAVCPGDRLECAFAAGKYVEVAAAATPKTPEAHYWRVRAYNALAAEAFGRLTALPPSVPSHEWLAASHRNERRYAEAVEEWRKAVALAPRDARLRVELALTHRLAGDFAAAQAVLEEVLRAAPDAADPNYLLGDVFLAQQQPERAIPLLEKAVRLAPGEPQVHGALGRAHALVGQPAAAIPHLQKALPADADGSVRLQLARALQAAGHVDQARLALRDYEEFRKAARPPEADAPESEGGLTPPGELPPPSGAATPPPR
ncbi:MAG TPA: tetratricopeptide repeat protein [Vicinamibacteria bacterium]|nr:tetratricopeptide repeat protein [Vicinamibacteria bacterium]